MQSAALPGSGRSRTELHPAVKPPTSKITTVVVADVTADIALVAAVVAVEGGHVDVALAAAVSVLEADPPSIAAVVPPDPLAARARIQQAPAAINTPCEQPDWQVPLAAG
jgi:hypothetical protein